MIDFNLSDLKPDLTYEGNLSPEMEEVFQFHNMLLGGAIRFREIHYNIPNFHGHKLTDHIMSGLMDFVDKLGEGVQGYDNQRVGFGRVVPIIPKSIDIVEILQALKTKADMLGNSLSSPTYSGITNILDDFKTNVNKWIYLASFS